MPLRQVSAEIPEDLLTPVVSNIDRYIRYGELRKEPQSDRVVARKSAIHGWGVFVERAFKKEEFIIEFTGEMIRNELASERENRFVHC